MAAQSSTQTHQEKQALGLEPSRRRSMRVLLSLPIRVCGKTIQNQDFEEQTRTLVVNAHGALISIEAAIAVDQPVVVWNKSTNQ